MQTIALIGKSGTGKSHKAQAVARENEVSYIIDDGLFIGGIQVLAGSSAKRETTKLSAVRRAIFQDPDHAAEVKELIRSASPEKILILGTSESMVEAICRALGLPMPAKRIYIEEVSTDPEIDTAQRSRKIEGKHVIPVPTFEIKKDFSGFLLDPLKIFYKRGRRTEIVEEKSVVRPTFSYLGRYSISDTTIRQIIIHTAQQVPGVGPGGRAILESISSGVLIKLELVVEYGFPLYEVLAQVQNEVVRAVEYMTALNVIKVDTIAKKIIMK